jgi:hypothetical protein
MKIRPVRVNLFHADVSTDWQRGMTKLTGGFRNSENAPNSSDYFQEKPEDYSQIITQVVIFGSLCSTAKNSGVFA